MNILDKIIKDKHTEVALKKQVAPEAALRHFPLFDRQPLSLATRLRSTGGIIAEHKRRSPSKAVINQGLKLWDVVKGYEAAGVAGISVLTDTPYFGGALQDLQMARACVNLPLLRKDFIIDPYQLTEAKAYGADVVLLIAAVLQPEQIRDLGKAARDLGMEVLLEVHNREELDASPLKFVDLLGVNNRNLKTFEVSLETSKNLAGAIPDSLVRVSESGIYGASDIAALQDYGYRGFLVGEHFMRQEDPGAAAGELIKNLAL